MSLKYGILGLLEQAPMTGYELMKIFNQSLNFFWHAQTSQIYRDLGDLEKKGFLHSKIEEQSGKPDKRLYNITDSCRESFLLWLNDCDFSSSLKYRDSLLIKIFFSSKGDSNKLISGLEHYVVLNEKHIESYKVAVETIDTYGSINDELNRSRVYWKMTLSKGLIAAKGNIEWANECIEVLKEAF